MVLAAKCGMSKLFGYFLVNGGDPLVLNDLNETCVHAVSSLPEFNTHSYSDDQEPAANKIPNHGAPLRVVTFNDDTKSNISRQKGEIVERIVQWIKTEKEYTPHEDLSHFLSLQNKDGNTGLHFASQNGLLPCIEKLVTNGAILSIFNRAHKCCVDLAEGAGWNDVATMLEVALLFSTITAYSSTPEYTRSHRNNHSAIAKLKGKLFVDHYSVSLKGLTDFIAQSIAFASKILCESYIRSEVLLWKYSWNFRKLIEESKENIEAVYIAANLQPQGGLTKGS